MQRNNRVDMGQPRAMDLVDDTESEEEFFDAQPPPNFSATFFSHQKPLMIEQICFDEEFREKSDEYFLEVGNQCLFNMTEREIFAKQDQQVAETGKPPKKLPKIVR